MSYSQTMLPWAAVRTWISFVSLRVSSVRILAKEDIEAAAIDGAVVGFFD